MEQEFAAPVKQVALARIHVRCNLVFVRSGHEFRIFFFQLAEEIVQFRGVFSFQEVLE